MTDKQEPTAIEALEEQLAECLEELCDVVKQRDAALARSDRTEYALGLITGKKEYFSQVLEKAEESAVVPRRIEGTWPADDLRRAFVTGAAWWNFTSTGFTMFSSERTQAESEAEQRFPNGKIPSIKEHQP